MIRNTFMCGLSAVLGAVVSGALLTYDTTPWLVAQEAGLAPVKRPPDDGGAAGSRLTPEELVNIGVYERANRGVVNINTKSLRTDSFFFVEAPTEGSGSGSMLDKEGHILTNYHVVDGAHLIEATLASGRTYPARLIGKDAINDVAVLKIKAPAEELYPLELGDSSRLRVGQKAFAIGNPFGLERTLTVGIVSSLNRALPSRVERRVMKSIIQIDAAMNPGNSGGPLLDTSSRLIGMNTAIASKTGQNTGVGFAIPVNRIRRIVLELIRTGQVTRPDIGITRGMQTEQGLLIATLVPGGPAERAGLRGFRIVRRQHRQGPFVYETRSIDRSHADLIIAAEGEAVRTVDDLLSFIEERKPGDEITLTVVRDGQAVDVAVRLGESDS